ncbi:MAG: hypothetical protein HQ517_10010 [SAR324 cluster bacterium]|nr:hypothetical protein [SAR324 cluster bacterium]
MTDYNSILLIVKAVIGIMVVFGLTVYVLRPLVRSLSATEDLMETSRTTFHRHTEEGELEIPTSGQPDVSKQMIIKTALKDPIRTTQLVRNWLREKK